MENFNLLLLHTIRWGRSSRQNRQNMWVRPVNMNRLEFGIFSPSPVQLVPKRWLCSPLLLRSPWERHGTLPAGAELKESAFPTPSNSRHTRSQEIGLTKTKHPDSLTRQNSWFSTRLCGYAPLQWTWIQLLWWMLGLTVCSWFAFSLAVIEIYSTRVGWLKWFK